MGAAQPASLKGETKVAEADNLMDWLSQPKQEAAPAAKPPKGKAAKGKGKYVAPVEAHFVGDKVCAGCHAVQIAEFKKTLMGRISITQPGKFDCENCHGPGSAHVKAGGGRGVGGIMSFEADDPRSAEEKNSVCLACHQRGDRTNWAGSTHEDARARLRQLPHDHEERVAQEPAQDRVRARHLLPVPQGPARADVPLVAYAAARRQDRVLGLP